MHKTLSIILALLAPACCSMLSNAAAAPLTPSLEDRYVAARDTAIQKFSKEYDAGKFDDTAQKAEDAARTDLQAQLSAILGEAARPDFGPATLNLETLYKGDEGFGMLDALRFDANVGTTGEKAGENGADGKYVEPQFGCKRSPMAPWIRRAVSDIGGGKADIEIKARTSAVTSSLIYIRAGWGAISRSPPVAKC